ncbi:KAT8 regulatory NSL complex subunit 1 [Onthophagus taurus]|uniref:KAT8 regulatory NSL complex subunit 1 n=1 Tax=Onthophagus taurus TaxID=166361 RepID=UPI0039BE2E55
MGLRTTSVRDPHVEVMAPALTEPNQTPNFKLLKEPPASSNDGHDVLDNCLDLATTELLLKEKGASVDTIEPITSDIMSQSPLSMGDQDDKMGLNILKDKSTTQDMDQIMNLDLGQNVDEIMQVIKSMEGGSSDLFNDVDVMNMSIEEPVSKETQTKELMAEVHKRQLKVERKLEFLLRRLRKMQIRHMGQHFSSEVAGVFEHVHRTLRRLKDNSPVNLNNELNLEKPTESNQSLEKMKPISSSSAKNLVRKLEMSSLLQSNVASRRHSGRYFGSGSAEPGSFRPGVSGMTNLAPWVPQHKQDLQRIAGLLHTEMGLAQQEVDSEATASSSGGESCDEMQTYNNPHQQYLSIHKRASWKYLQERASIAARWTWLQAQISDLEYRIRQHSELHKTIRHSKGPVQLGYENPPSFPSSPTTTTPTGGAAAVNGYRGQLPGDVLQTIGDGAMTLEKEYQCARTRPLINFRKRKLLQTTGLHAVSKKAARPSTIRCGCTKPAVPCALCTGRTDPTHPRDPSDYLSKAEKVAMLDPSFHPVFSLPEDCSSGIHLEAIMKTPDWQQRSSRTTIKGMKYITKGGGADRVNDKLNATSVDHRSKKVDHRKKYTNRLLKPATVNALSAKLKNKFKGRKTSISSAGGGNNNNNCRHLSSSQSLAKLNKKQRHHSHRVSMGSASGDCEDEELEGLGSLGGSIKFDSPSTSPLLATQSISGFQRRNRVDSYDIDNIVIPYSVAASTRVEKLQYKEILTPKWRVVEVTENSEKTTTPPTTTPSSEKNNGAVKNPSQQPDSGGDIEEDLSDEAVIVRHDRCEYDEKKKFLSYLKLPLGYGRSRSHKRTDSRAESSGANTPDPMSPHATPAIAASGPHLHNNASTPNNNTIISNNIIDPPTINSENNFNLNLPSPITSPPATPLSVTTDDNSNTSSSAALRRRTISQSKFGKDRLGVEGRCEDFTRCGTPVEHFEVNPYERRCFPLTDEMLEKMLGNENHKFKTNYRARDSDEILSTTTTTAAIGGVTSTAVGGSSSAGCNEVNLEDDKSHDSESTESAYGDEDPNDPEWVDMERTTKSDRFKR